MASVGAAYRGQCASREVQLELLRFIEELAKCSHSFFEWPEVRSWDTREPQKPPQIKFWDTRIQGNIFLFDDLMTETAARRCGIQILETEEDGLLQRIFEGEKRLVRWPVLKEAYLHGIQFGLYDPAEWPVLKGSYTTMSFVFLSDECPI